MNLMTMRLRVAENLRILSQDNQTVLSGSVTATSIDNRINDIYLEEIFPLLSEKFPKDFYQKTYPQSTYTATGTVSSSSTGTTLVTTTSVFNNTMEGMYVHNATDDELIKIETYTSATQVTLESTIGDTWDGDTIYVLGNEFTLAGDVLDIKEIISVGIKYAGTETNYRRCEFRSKEELYPVGDESYSSSNPYAYRTTILDNGVMKPAIGFIPSPSTYLGKFEVEYIARPSRLSEYDEPLLNTAGLSEVLINGATEWGFRVLKDWESAASYRALFEGKPGDPNPGGKFGLIRNYRPKSKSERPKIRMSPLSIAMQRRGI